MGTYRQYGEAGFSPSNPVDRFEKHDKNSIASFDQYNQFLENQGLKQGEITLLKEQERYDELFERYSIPEIDRNYVFYSELKKMDPQSVEYHEYFTKFERLAAEIPELYYEGTKPTIDSYLQASLSHAHRNDEVLQS